MSEILEPFFRNLVSSLVLFFVLLVAVAAAFARGKTLQLFLGFLRIVVSLVYSPFVYLRRAILGICRFSEKGEADYAGSEQYLLGKFFLTAQAAVVVLALAAAAAGISAAWTAFLPPKSVREEARETRKALDERRRELEAATARKKDLERKWVETRDYEMQRARSPHQDLVRRSLQEKASAEARLAGDPPAASHVLRLRGFIQKEGVKSSQYDINEMRQRMERSLFAIEIQPSSVPVLQEWIAAWEREALAEFRMRRIDENEVRAEAQPDWREAERDPDRLGSAVSSLESRLRELEEQSSFRFGRASLVLSVSFGWILAYLWVAGIVLESAALAVRVADDVRRLREAQGGLSTASIRRGEDDSVGIATGLAGSPGTPS